MRSTFFARWTGAVLTVAALLVLSACGRDTVDEDHDDLVSLEVIDQSQTEQPTVATWTLAGGWEGDLPDISLSAAEPFIALGFRAFTEDGDEITLSETGEHSIRYRVAPGADAGVVDMDADDELFHGDHVHVYGEAAGTTQLRFILWHAGHAERETSNIDITVVE